MKTPTLAVALLALGLVLPPVVAQDERDVNAPRDIVPDQGTIDCLRRLGPECFVVAPTIDREVTVEPVALPGCEIVPSGFILGGRDYTGDGERDTGDVWFDGGWKVDCPTLEIERPPEPGLCNPTLHLHGTYSGGAWQGGTVAHMHHNNLPYCHYAGGYWTYTGNCGSVSGYGHDQLYVSFCDFQYHQVCMNLHTQNGEWTGWHCWTQYN